MLVVIQRLGYPSEEKIYPEPIIKAFVASRNQFWVPGMRGSIAEGIGLAESCDI